jgi:hypothetical protein
MARDVEPVTPEERELVAPTTFAHSPWITAPKVRDGEDRTLARYG